MRWESSLSRQNDLDAALDECAASIGASLGDPAAADFAAVFASPRFTRQASALAAGAAARFPNAALIGCSAAGVIGSGREEEDQAALSVTAGVLPDVTVSTFHVRAEDLPSPDAPPDAWSAVVGAPLDADPHFVVLAEPFSMDGEALLAGLDYAYPRAVKIGGLASGGNQLAPHALFRNGEARREGAVGAALSGNIVIDSVVAQGCRPIGSPMRVTGAEGNMLYTLDGESSLDRLRRVYDSLPPRDQELIRRNLFMGVAMDPLAERAGGGEFLIRNVMGIDPRAGAVAVAAPLREGQLVQFHVRDAETSADDLRGSLADYASAAGERGAAGALLFSCTGRGRHLYGRPDHDTDLFRDALGPLPLGGFFCNGEIGPVAGTTYLHGYTSSFALFRPRVGAA